MVISQTSNQPSKAPHIRTSLLQLVLSALAALILLGVSVLIAVMGVVQYFNQGSASLDLTQSFMIAASLAFAGVLVLPSAYYAWKHLSSPGSEPTIRLEPRGFGLILTLLVLVVVLGALWLGNWVSQNDQLAWFLLPFLNIIVNGLPTLWLVYIGIRGLNPGLPRHQWGVFASGLVLSPALILMLELLALVGFGMMAFLWTMLDPGGTNQLQSLIFRLQSSAPSPDAILHILLPFLLQPGILFVAFAFISVIVPIIEESLKPIGVWFLASQNLNPAQGFALGVLCGAGFGLFENLGNTSAGGEAWALLVTTRISTLLLHCLTTGLVGWALASAWSQKRYLRLGITYAFTIVLHGLWNGMAVLSAISSLEGQVYNEIPANLQQIGSLATIGVIALATFNLVLYIGFNAVLRNSIDTQASLSTGDGVTPNLTMSGSPPTKQSESITNPIMLSSSPPSVEAPPLPSSGKQNFPVKDNNPTYPESNP